MNIPDLTRIVDTYIPITSTNFTEYYNQLRYELAPFIRKLQNDEILNWFSLLIHEPNMLKNGITKNRKLPGNDLFIHILLEPKKDIDISEFIKELPQHFLEPMQITKSNIDGFVPSFFQKEDWAYAWKLHGEASEYVLSIIENHKNSIPIEHIIQLLHFITNPLHLGHQCMFFPNGFIRF